MSSDRVVELDFINPEVLEACSVPLEVKHHSHGSKQRSAEQEGNISRHDSRTNPKTLAVDLDVDGGLVVGMEQLASPLLGGRTRQISGAFGIHCYSRVSSDRVVELDFMTKRITEREERRVDRPIPFNNLEPLPPLGPTSYRRGFPHKTTLVP